MAYPAIGLQTFPSLLLVCHGNQFVVASTGGVYSPGMSDDPLGISRSSAAGYILGGVANVLQGDLQENVPPIGSIVLISENFDRDPLHSYCVKRMVV